MSRPPKPSKQGHFIEDAPEELVDKLTFVLACGQLEDSEIASKTMTDVRVRVHVIEEVKNVNGARAGMHDEGYLVSFSVEYFSIWTENIPFNAESNLKPEHKRVSTQASAESV